MRQKNTNNNRTLHTLTDMKGLRAANARLRHALMTLRREYTPPPPANWLDVVSTR